MRSEAARRAARLERLREGRRWFLYHLEVRYCRQFCPEALGEARGGQKGEKDAEARESV